MVDIEGVDSPSSNRMDSKADVDITRSQNTDDFRDRVLGLGNSHTVSNDL